MTIRPRFPYRTTVGLDWADQKHNVFVRFANGDSYRRKIDSRPEAIQEWLLELRSACAEGKIAIALEQRRGALYEHARLAQVPQLAKVGLVWVSLPF